MSEGSISGETPKSNVQPETKITNDEKIILVRKSLKTLGLISNDDVSNEPKRTKKGITLEGVKTVLKERKQITESAGARFVQGPAEKPKPEPEPEPEPKPEPQPEPQPQPEPKPEPQPEPEFTPPELNKVKNIGIATDPTREQQQVGANAEHDRSRDKPARNFLRTLISPITNPREFFRNFWQNAIFKDTFRTRSLSFARSLEEIAHDHAKIDSSIPLQISQDILDSSVREGREMRKKDNVVKRFWYTFYDLGSGITGLYQNSDMVYAKKWFKENGKTLVEEAKKISIGEQTQLGERFALDGKNEDVISDKVGEKRFLLTELIPDKKVCDEFQNKIKELITESIRSGKPIEEVLKEFNLYYYTKVLPQIPEAQRKEIEGVEVSSNIKNIIDNLLIKDEVTRGVFKTRFDRYQGETNDKGQKKWDELEFKIFAGRAKYAPERGEVRLSALEKKLVDQMVERDYKISNGLVLNSARETLIDLGIYAATFGVGALGAPIFLGRSIGTQAAFALSPFTGMAAVSVMAGSREGFVFSQKGKIKGLRGKAITDFEQASREKAAGRTSIDKAKLRPQYEKAMVDQRPANELSQSIINFLEKKSLTPDESKQMMITIAHAKARMQLGDLSTIKGKEFWGVGELNVSQNFIGYSQDKRNEEITALRAAIVQGVVRLAKENPELSKKLTQAQIVMESQLKVGSYEEKMIAKIIQDDPSASAADAKSMVTDYFQGLGDLGIDTRAGKSLEKSAYTLAKLVDRRALGTTAMAFIVSPIIGAEIKEIADFGGDLIHGLATGNPLEYFQDWGQVFHGDIPIELKNGTVVSDLTPLQQGTLMVRNMVEPPPDLLGIHDTVIDGVKLQLPGALRYTQTDLDHNGQVDHDYIVDIRSGKVLLDMSDMKLIYDSTGKLVMTNLADQILKMEDPNNPGQYLSPDQTLIYKFNESGIKLIQDPRLAQHSGLDNPVFQPGATHEQPVPGLNVKVTVPDNCHLEKDDLSGKYDLYGNNIDGTSRLLIDDATISSNGQITGGLYDHNLIQINNGLPIFTGVAAPTAEPHTAVSSIDVKDFWDSKGSHDLNMVHMKSDDAVALKDYIYNAGAKDSQGNDLYRVELKWIDTKILPGPHDAAFQPTQMSDHQNNLYVDWYVPKMGHIQVMPTEGWHPEANSHGQLEYTLDLNPADTDPVHLVTSPQFGTMQVGQFAQMVLNQTQLREHVPENIDFNHALNSEMDVAKWDVFNLRNPADPQHNGHIFVGFMDDKGTFRVNHAITGSSDIGGTVEVQTPPVEIPTPPTEQYLPIITIGNIVEKKEVTTFGYQLETPPWEWWKNIPLVPVPARPNIEKSKKGESSGQTPKITTVETESRFSWEYERLSDDIRIFPEALTYAALARDLKKYQPAQYGRFTDQELAKKVKEELMETQKTLDEWGLTRDELKNLSLGFIDKEVLSHYRKFIKEKYNISLPVTEEILILPISGSIAQLYNSSGRTLAFVDTRYPVIFLDFRTIPQAAAQLAGHAWAEFSLEEKTEYIKRLLREINPHEYTHLLSDIAFWNLIKHNENADDEQLESLVGKTGLKMGKPRNLKETNYNINLEYFERGRGLNEAVTVELTKQWARSMNTKIDIPAYSGERQILYALQNLIAQENSISTDEVFERFVHGYFDHKDFRHLVELVDGRTKKPDGKFSSKRPHFMTYIYSLMEYESKKNSDPRSTPYYPLTYNFIFNKLDQTQKTEVIAHLEEIKKTTGLSDKIIEEFKNYLAV